MAGLSPHRAVAQEEEVEPVSFPLVMVNAARLDRLFANADQVFDEIDRPELSESIGAFMAEVQDAKGMRRDLPFGMMLYIESGFSFQLAAVMYLPCDDLSALASTLSRGRGTLKEVPEEPDRYELLMDNTTLQLLQQGNYVLVTRSPTALDRRFPDVESYALALESRFDLHVSLAIDSVPIGTRTVFLDFLRIQAESTLQPRDDEPEARYRLRKAQGLNALKSVEQLVEEGREISLGVLFSQEERDSFVEVRVTAVPDSAFAKAIRKSAGRASGFLPLLDDNTAFNLAGSGELDDNGVVYMKELIDIGRTRLSEDLGSSEGADSTNADRIEALWNALEAAVEKRTFDMFFRFHGDSTEEYAAIMALRLSNAGDLDRSLEALLEELSDVLPRFDERQRVETRVTEVEGRPVHRILLDVRGEDDRKILGEEVSLWITNSNRAIWLAIGDNAPVPQLRSLVKKFESPDPNAEPPKHRGSVQGSARLSQWKAMVETDDDQAREILDAAIQPNNDEIRLDISAIDSGARLRLYLPPGLTRLIGLIVAEQLDAATEF